MARNKNDQDISQREINNANKANKRISGNLNIMLDKLQGMLYGGSSDNGVVDRLNSEFTSVLNNELNIIHEKNTNITSFIEKIVSNAEKNQASMVKQIEDFLDGSGNTQLDEQMQSAYQNNLIKREDIHEVTSKLNELMDAIRITRDAIVSSDISQGRMQRTLTFGNLNDEDSAQYISIVEQLEERFDLQRKIKNFIVPKTLEQGVYYTYCVPYSKMFDDFDKFKKKYGNNLGLYSESVMDINTKSSKRDRSNNAANKLNYMKSIIEKIPKPIREDTGISDTNDASRQVCTILNNIEISNDPICIPFIRMGAESMDKYFTEKGLYHESTKTEMVIEAVTKKKSKNRFDDINKLDDGMIDHSKEKNQFSNIKDCYIKMIPSKNLIPVNLVDKRIGYYYVYDNGMADDTTDIGHSIYDARYCKTRKTETFSSIIANEIVKSFDKKFLDQNSEFKDYIVEAINFYNINERKLKFQFIPAEYIVEHAINEDENGEPHSIVERSLFYAKLYLVLLLFKMMSIIDYSNDTKVHYIRTSGIDKNISNKIQEITRKMQSRKINILDMFSYTTLVNKIGNGTDRYVPVGPNEVRGVETETLSGQDVQLNTELMELLKTAYISATGCPSVMMNYINEADFAKSLELGNATFTDNIISHQLDFNGSITLMYKLIMRYATDIPEDVINQFKFSFAPPKNAAINITRDMLDSFEAFFNSMIPVGFGSKVANAPDEYDEELRLFRIKLLRDQLPMIKVDNILKYAEESRREAIEARLKQKSSGEDEQSEETNGY